MVALEVQEENGAWTTKHSLRAGPAVIGRHDFAARPAVVSRAHLEVWLEDGGAFVKPVGQNACFLRLEGAAPASQRKRMSSRGEALWHLQQADCYNTCFAQSSGT